jgi:DNA-binding NtrC family response regulator
MHHKILIVDDDPGVCNSLALLLRSEKYDVDKTTDNEEATALIKKNKYDVCLFDYKMKGLNGRDLLKTTKEVSPQCPVFIVSGMMGLDVLLKKEIKAGLLAGIINKPFNVEVLLQKIRDVI